MKLAVLSGKGGAGKTFVAVNLAVTARQAVYIDCDVEEPNGRLFLKPEIEAVTPVLIRRGIKPLIITNDVVTTEDAKHVQRELDGILEAEKIVGVETGACPHTAIREDPSMNLAAVEELESKFPDSDLIFIESGGDNLTLTFSPALADFFIYVIDVAAGDKIPRKSGPGVCQSDILVINKEDLAPYVKASLEVMDRDSRKMRDGKPFIFTNCMTGKNIEELTDMIIRDALFDFKPAEKTA